MLNALLAQQQNALNHFFQHIDIAAAEKVLNKLHACEGVILLTPQKISTTLISTGTRSTFLSPSHALHGDLGFVSSKDLFLSFSKSGESEELLSLIPYIRKRGVYTIAVVSQHNSHLASLSDFSIFLPVERELCPHNLAPTTSTAVQLLFGDCLAVALMLLKQFTAEDFAANHPAGFLGRKMTLTVSDLMVKGEDIPRCLPATPLLDALHELTSKQCGCLLVCNAARHLEGIFTDGDLRRAIQTKGAQVLQQPLSQLMTKQPVTTTPTQLAIDVMRQMEQDQAHRIAVLPVLEAGCVVGLICMHDIVQAGLN